ncbi:rhodanese-like domain-containing protein [Pseudomonas sp. NPDC090202]|uniref:rhodanese-like domain-containing protein n=1 Tax=unclassified Pseudomonas TaxID=196821 RepID=UPI0037F39044
MVDHLIAFATNHYLISGAFVILLALLIATELSKGGKSLSTGQLTAMVNNDSAVVIDVRAKKDYATGHIVGALNFPQDKLMSRTSELEKYKSKTLIIVDAAGQHAGHSASELLKAGFTAAKLSGGISSWRADNLPLVK